jgi:hypothetical protein
LLRSPYVGERKIIKRKNPKNHRDLLFLFFEFFLLFFGGGGGGGSMLIDSCTVAKETTSSKRFSRPLDNSKNRLFLQPDSRKPLWSIGDYQSVADWCLFVSFFLILFGPVL